MVLVDLSSPSNLPWRATRAEELAARTEFLEPILYCFSPHLSHSYWPALIFSAGFCMVLPSHAGNDPGTMREWSAGFQSLLRSRLYWWREWASGESVSLPRLGIWSVVYVLNLLTITIF